MAEAVEIARRRNDRATLSYALTHQHFMIPEAADPRERHEAHIRISELQHGLYAGSDGNGDLL